MAPLALTIKSLFLRALVSIVRHYFAYGDWKKAYPTASAEYTIPSSKGTRSIRIRKWAAPDESDGLRPVHVNFHGSGFVFHNLGEDSDYCQLLSQSLNITVLDCDYTKGPSEPFPAAYEDAQDVFSHVLSSSAVYDLSNFTVGGFSAGASLSLTASATYSPQIKALVANYPPIDMSVPSALPQKPRAGSTGVELEPWVIEFFWQSYIPPNESRKDPRISPKFMDLDALPRKICFVSAEKDALRPEGDEFVGLLKEAGVDVASLVVKDTAHAFDKSARPGTWEYERKTEMYDFIVAFLRGVYAA